VGEIEIPVTGNRIEAVKFAHQGPILQNFLSNTIKLPLFEVLNTFATTYLLPSRVTRLGDLLDFAQLFTAFATINLPKSSTFLVNLCKGVKIIHFSSEINFGQLL